MTSPACCAQVAIIWVGSEDITRYFPDHVLLNGDEGALRLVAERIVNTTLSCVAEVKSRFCGAHAVLLGALPQGNAHGSNSHLYEDFRPITEEINLQLREAAVEIGDGVDFLDCGAEVMYNDKFLDPNLVPSGRLEETDRAAIDGLASCIHRHLKQLESVGILAEVASPPTP